MTPALRSLLIIATLASSIPAQGADTHGLAIERGVDWLITTQALDGSWRGYGSKHPTGVTALCVYTLLKCGLPSDHQAISRGMAFIDATPPKRTYAVSATLMACRALDAAHRPRPLIKQLTKILTGSLQRTGWGYPSNATGDDPVYADTSNTQYALLGLRAAAAMGERVSKKLWREAAEALLRRQGRSGGFGYQRSERPTGAMTVAALASMIICKDALPSRDGKQGKLKAASKKAMTWLTRNWSMTRHVAKPKPTKDTDRWFLYYLYGVERLAAFLGQDRIEGRDWYAEGAPGVIRSQKKEGNWQLGMSEIDTCFALLFLTRGSRQTGLAPRVLAERAAAADSAFVIGRDPGHPVKAWFRKPGAEMRRLTEAGHAPTQLTWLVDGKPVSTSDIGATTPLEGQALTWTAPENGRRTLTASLRMVASDGTSKKLISNALLIKVDHLPPEGSTQVISALKDNLLRGRDITCEASSHSKWTRPIDIVDGTHARRWMSAPEDSTPWVHLRFGKPVRGKRLALISAIAPRKASDHLARPKDIEVSFGGRKPKRITLDDTTSAWQTIPLPSKAISQLRIRVLTRYPGKTSSLGFAELAIRRR